VTPQAEALESQQGRVEDIVGPGMIRRKSGKVVPINTLDVVRFIEVSDFLTDMQKKLLQSLVVLGTNENADEGGPLRSIIAKASLRRISKRMGKRTESTTPDERRYRSERQVRRIVRALQSYGVLKVSGRRGRANEYEIVVDALKSMADKSVDLERREQRSKNENVPKNSLPVLVEPFWMPPIGRNEDRHLVGAILEAMISAVLRRPATAFELREHSLVALKLWRDRGCPEAHVIVGDIEKVVAASKACQNHKMRWIRGEHIIPKPDSGAALHDWTQRVGTVLNPRLFEVRLAIANDHAGRGPCGCHHGMPANRSATSQAYTAEELARLEERRQHVARFWWPRLERQLASFDPELPGTISAELRAELLDVTVYDRWTIGHAWVDSAWAWLAQRGIITARPRSPGANGPPG
jgi:hypothetical protein